MARYRRTQTKAQEQRNARRRTEAGERSWYYTVGKEEGQNVLSGPYDTEEDGYQFGYQNLEGDWEVIALPTRDMKRANQIVRQRNVDGGQTVGEVLKRTKHKF